MRNSRYSSNVDAALLVLRLIVGLVFVVHGGQKLFVFGLGNVAGNFAKMGIPAASLTGPLVALVELLGGLGFIGGLLTRLSGLGLAIDMLGAIFFVHLAKGFMAPMGFEYPLTLLAVSAALMVTGAGRYSIDHMIAARRGRVEEPATYERERTTRVA